jgi:flagellin-like hook-associated protein FlgL
MDVSLSAASRSALLALTGIQSDMGKFQLRLATGKRVNSPVDDPNAYFLSQSLSARAATLGGLSAKISTAQSTIDAANNGLATIQSLLSSAQSIANQALQSTEALTTVTGTNSSALTTATVIASTSGSSTKLKAGDTITVSDGTTTATYTAANNDTVQTILDAVNNTANLKVTASLNSSGQIKFSATSNVNITIGGTLNGSGTLNGVVGLTAGTTNYTTNTIRQNLATQFNSLRTQIDQAAQDAGVDGVNLLTGGSLSVDFNENGTSSLTVSGVSGKSADLGLTASSNTWQLDTDINASLDQITTAINSLEAYTATFGSMGAIMKTRSDFNSAMITTLNSGADALVASDVNEDSAMLLALQTRQQIATAALSFTQDANSTALKLFGL